jgi:hypothetical protein
MFNPIMIWSIFMIFWMLEGYVIKIINMLLFKNLSFVYTKTTMGYFDILIQKNKKNKYLLEFVVTSMNN